MLPGTSATTSVTGSAPTTAASSGAAEVSGSSTATCQSRARGSTRSSPSGSTASGASPSPPACSPPTSSSTASIPPSTASITRPSPFPPKPLDPALGQSQNSALLFLHSSPVTLSPTRGHDASTPLPGTAWIRSVVTRRRTCDGLSADPSSSASPNCVCYRVHAVGHPWHALRYHARCPT